MVGVSLGHYKILSKLGEGGMGVVYLAEDTNLERKVALKLLPQAALHDSVARKRFSREAKSAAALDNPFICKIYETGEAEGEIFIAMEYVEGGTLRDRMRQQPLSTEESVRIALEAAEALQVAHDHSIIHRDFKPSNIMLTPEGHAKVTDFGLAKQIVQDDEVDPTAETAQAENLTEWGTTLGTLAYMSPEQLRASPLQASSDIFSFGVVLCEMLSGQHPFARPSTADTIDAIINTEPESLRDSDHGGLVPDLQRILGRCLEKDPGRRYQTAGELAEDLRSIYRQPLSGSAPAFRDLIQKAKKPRTVLASILAAAVLLVLVFWSVQEKSKDRWARDVVIPEIERLIENDDYVAAFYRAEEIEDLAQGTKELQDLWARMSQNLSVITTPDSARIFFRPYAGTDVAESYLGESPLEKQRVPLGLYWLRIEKDGYEEINGLLRGIDHYESPEIGKEYSFQLLEEGNSPPGMVRIPDSTVTVRDDLLPELTASLSSYLIDTHEVTNKEFKEFVDAGGYRNPEYWEHELVKDGRVLSFEAAITEFRDQTGRPGPSTWEVGTFLEGQEDYPVAGVSWYEAAAYAKFADKSLPSIFHWLGATDTQLETYVTPDSNFSNQGPRPVGTGPPGPLGTYDMAGNVKEWCQNPSQDLRFNLGGGWKERTYAFSNIDLQSPFTRSDTYGFRCIKYLEPSETTREELSRSIQVSHRSPMSVGPVSDEILDAYMSQYAYDHTELDAVVESVDESSDYWTRERVTLNAPYEDDRLIAHVFRPKNVEPPLQTVIFFPGSGAQDHDSIDGQVRMIDFLVKSGRAVVYPIYKGTIDRRDGFEKAEKASRRFSEHVIEWVNEVRRSIDYLETREDIDMERLAYYGFSWGGRVGPIVLALDDRFRAGVFLDGGLSRAADGRRPEVREMNFAPRVTVPILMINGSHDVVFPVETSQRPLLSLLGTPEGHKRHVIYESGHCVIGFWRNQVVRDILNWLDEYLGPVAGSAPTQ